MWLPDDFLYRIKPGEVNSFSHKWVSLVVHDGLLIKGIMRWNKIVIIFV